VPLNRVAEMVDPHTSTGNRASEALTISILDGSGSSGITSWHEISSWIPQRNWHIAVTPILVIGERSLQF